MHTTTVPVLYRHKETERFESVECAYRGPVARKVWASVNKQFLKLHAANYFYPCEPADAYHAAIREVERVAERLVNSDEKPVEVSVETYLMNVGYKALYHFHCRVVAPMREEYRRLEKKVLTKEEDESLKESQNAAEGADVGAEAFAAACVEGENSEPPQPMTAQQLAEALPGEPDAVTRRREAAFLLEEIYAKLSEEVVRAFRAYVAAEGNLFKAAHLARMSRSEFYRKWPTYLKQARKAAMTEVVYDAR